MEVRGALSITRPEDLPADREWVVGESCSVRVRGDVDAGEVAFAGTLTWEPGPGGQAAIGYAADLRVVAADHDPAPTLRLARSGSRLRLTGRARVDLQEAHGSLAPRRERLGADLVLGWDPHARLRLSWAGTRAEVRCQPTEGEADERDRQGLPALVLEALGAGSGTDGELHLSGARFGHLAVEAHEGVTVRVTAGDGAAARIEHLEVAGAGSVAPVGQVGELLGPEDKRASAPKLVLAATHVTTASGRLGLVVSGDGYLSGAPGRPPTLTSLEAARPVGAMVEGVDPTALPVEDLDALKNLLSFEAAPRSLIAWARSAAPGRRLLGGRPVDERALRLAYEWIFRYSRAVHHRAVSGATHSATRWALARVGHAAAPSRLERVARCALWSLGYGFRAGPAVAAWLVCAAVAWVVATWRTPPWAWVPAPSSA